VRPTQSDKGVHAPLRFFASSGGPSHECQQAAFPAPQVNPCPAASGAERRAKQAFGPPCQSPVGHPPGNKKKQVEANGRADDQQDDGEIRPSGYAAGACFLRLSSTLRPLFLPSPRRAAAPLQPEGPGQGLGVREMTARAPPEGGPRGSEPVSRARRPLRRALISLSHPSLPLVALLLRLPPG
jgi:hypothetical protein